MDNELLFNELKSFFKKEKHRLHPLRISDEMQEFIEDTYGAPDKGEMEFEEMQKLEAAERYMQHLLVRIVNYHILHDMTNKEIAHELHMSERKVKEKRAEGMKELQHLLETVDKRTIH